MVQGVLKRASLTRFCTQPGCAAPLYVDSDQADVCRSSMAVEKSGGIQRPMAESFMKLIGAFLYPNRALTEMALHLPPLEVILDIQTVKFMCKVLTSDDFLTCTLLQIEGSIPDLFHQQITSLKEFIHWSYPEQFGRRTNKVDLLEVKQMGNSLHYTKDVIQKYQEHRWKRLRTSQMSVLESTNTYDIVENLICNMDSRSVALKKKQLSFQQ